MKEWIEKNITAITTVHKENSVLFAGNFNNQPTFGLMEKMANTGQEDLIVRCEACDKVIHTGTTNDDLTEIVKTHYEAHQ